MHLSGVVKIEYLLGSQSLNVLLWGIQNSVSTRCTKPYCLTCQVLSLLLSAGVDTIPEYRYNWSWPCCWVVEEISNAMLCRGVFAIIVVGSIGCPSVEARISMNSTPIILKVWWIVVDIMKRTMVKMTTPTVGHASTLTLTLLIDSHGGKQKGDRSFASFLSLVVS